MGTDCCKKASCLAHAATDFSHICLRRAEEYAALLAATPARASDYSFINLWGWAETYGLTWKFSDGLCWIRQERPAPALWAPVGPWDCIAWRRELIPDARLIRVPGPLAERLAGDLGAQVLEAREHWDYLYCVRELVELSGNRFHKKKNLLNQFRKLYDWTYSPLTADCVEQALELQDAWCLWRDCESDCTLVQENEAIYRVLTNWDRLPGLIGGALRVEGRMVAYTVAEALDPDTLVIHFEKGHPEFKGVYQAVNQTFLEREAQLYRLVNREQDLGDEGLRKAKLSYNPVDFMKKCEVLL